MPQPEFKIEKSVPMPDRQTRYPFIQMEVGDSFFVPTAQQERARQAAWTWGKNNEKKFMSRRVDDGLRIWRTE